jgi:hypothetical protein
MTDVGKQVAMSSLQNYLDCDKRIPPPPRETNRKSKIKITKYSKNSNLEIVIKSQYREIVFTLSDAGM